MTQPEARFKAAVRTGLRTAFAQQPFFTSPIVAHVGQKTGMPDIFLIAFGLTLWIETKVAPNALSKSQEAACGRMVAAGARVEVLSAHFLELEPKHRFLSRRLFGYNTVYNHPWSALNDLTFWKTSLGCP